MNAIFTICAKNYLAQALTLKKSAEQHNPQVDFFIFLADKKTEDISNLDVIELDDSWLLGWESLAFKYNVIEFSTSIKPFCFGKLFKSGYDKVIYLDPDIYVTDNLSYIFDSLDQKSMMITPHYNHIETVFTGAVSEEELLFVGIYNLGFGAIKNNVVGNKIIDWWQNRLFDKCYADKEDSLHVDQRWIDFLPAFFPNDIYISHHPGVNIAIWNLHERELIIDEGRYIIKDLETNNKYPLLFFHFSGFDPYNTKVINRRHPKYNTHIFPSFVPIIEDYTKNVYENNYDFYSGLKYSFNRFSNQKVIIPLHRRLFRRYLEENRVSLNPFDSKALFYQLLESHNLILDGDVDFNLGIKRETKIEVSKIDYIFNKAVKIFIFLFGVKRYYFLIKYIRMKTRLENQDFIINI